MPKHLTQSDVGDFVAATQVGAANGIAQLGSDGKVVSGQLPAAISNPVLQVNGHTGPDVALTATDVGALDTTAGDGRYVVQTARGAVNGVAALDGGAHVPVAQVPDLSATYVRTGALMVNVMDHGAAGNGTTDDSAAIVASIGLLGASGGVVYLPPGSYLLNGATVLALTTAGTVLRGAGAENTKIIIGSGFSGASAVSITSYNCQVRDLSINGASSTTTSNPVADGIRVTGVRRAKVDRCYFANINGWAINVASTNANGSSNAFGTQISQVYMNTCAGTVRFHGDTAQTYAMNCQVSNLQSYQGGVTTGGSANLDGIRIEDSWDVLVSNAIVWMASGTGSSLNVVGNSAAAFVMNLDALGPVNTGPCVRVQDGANGSPQNVQITGGVIQQGSIGMQISGGSKHVRVGTSRFINNATHGVQVDGTGSPVYLDNLFFSSSGSGASGSNYDINWSGTTTGFVQNCYFASPIVAIGTAGVQQSVNIAAGQSVRFLGANFQGTGAASTNWFTNFPMVATRVDGTNMEHIGSLDFRLPTNARVSLRPVAAGNNALALNVNGADSVDRFRLLGDGTQEWGTGSATRDTTWGRRGVAQVGTLDSDVIIGLAGKGLQVKEGTNAKMGTAVLVAGTVTVSTTAVTANSRIFLTNQVLGGTAGFLRVSARTAGTSFAITSSSGSDASTVAWWMVEPA